MKGNDFTSVVETFLSRAHKSPWRQTDRHTKQRNSIIIIRTTRVMTYTQRTAFKPDYFNFQKLGHPKKTKTKNKTKNKHIYIYITNWATVKNVPSTQTINDVMFKCVVGVLQAFTKLLWSFTQKWAEKYWHFAPCVVVLLSDITTCTTHAI